MTITAIYSSVASLVLSLPLIGPLLNVVLLTIPSGCRGLIGKFGASGRPLRRPKENLILYEYEVSEN